MIEPNSASDAATQEFASSDTQPVRKRGISRSMLVLVCVLLFGGIAILLLLPASKWMLMESAQLVHYVGAFAAGCMLFAIAAHLLHRQAEGHGDNADQVTAHSPVSKPKVAMRWVLTACATTVAVGAEMAVHFAATDIHHHLEEALPSASQLYSNRDVAQLVGETLGVMTFKARDEEKDPTAKETLGAIARVIPEEWLKLADANDPRVVPLTEKELWQFVEKNKSVALDNVRWEGLVEEWTKAARARQLAEEPRRRLIDTFTNTFCFAWREALKHDYTHNGKASEAMRLDLFGELLRRTSDNANASDADIKASLARLQAINQRLRQQQAHRGGPEAKKKKKARARAVER